jgi:hypothetical protein
MRRWTIVAISLVGLAVALLWWWWQQTEQGRALRALPPADRVGLYERTLENLKTVCDPAPGRSVREFCREQATIILELPECDGACRALAQRHLSVPIK